MRGPTLLVSAIHIDAAGFGKVKKKEMCSSRAMCLHRPAVRKEPFPIIDFIAFEDGFTPSGFWKHMLYHVTHTSLTFILFFSPTRSLAGFHRHAQLRRHLKRTHTQYLPLNNAH